MSQELRIYKPNKSNSGAASKFQVTLKERKRGEKSFEQLMCFLTMSKQTGVDAEDNASFGWSDPTKEVIMLISPLDAASIIAGLVGMEKETKLFHQNSSGSTTLSLSRADNGMLYLKTSSKKGSDAPVQINHSVTNAEAILLKIYLEKFIECYYSG